jgi:CBS-domain-containing membrane protein
MYEFLEETVLDNMTVPAKTVAPEVTVGDLLRLFGTGSVDAYPVESDGRLIGIVSKADALKAFALKQDHILPHYDDAMGTTVEEVMSRHVMTVDPETKLQRVLHLMEKYHFKSLPVIDAGCRLRGMIAREDVILALARCNRRRASAQMLPLPAPPVGYYAIA